MAGEKGMVLLPQVISVGEMKKVAGGNFAENHGKDFEGEILRLSILIAGIQN
jgi:hypothetical protein